MRKNGTLGLGAIKRTLLEEFIHAVDIIMGGAPPESSGIQPSATGKGFFSKILAGDFEKITTKKPEDLPQRAYDYLTKPEEVYAKLKRIKIKLKDSKLGIGTVFDKDGKIDLDQLKLFLEDPDSQDAYPKSKFYDFGVQIIDGEIKKPTALYVDSKQKVKFERLLSLKKSFISSLNDSAKERTFK